MSMKISYVARKSWSLSAAAFREEANHFGAGGRTSRIGVRTAGSTTEPRMVVATPSPKAMASRWPIEDRKASVEAEESAIAERMIAWSCSLASRMAGLIDLISSGEIGKDSTVLYAHLGGQPALNAYSGIFD